MNTQQWNIEYPGDVLTKHLPILAELGFSDSPRKREVTGTIKFSEEAVVKSGMVMSAARAVVDRRRHLFSRGGGVAFAVATVAVGAVMKWFRSRPRRFKLTVGEGEEVVAKLATRMLDEDEPDLFPDVTTVGGDGQEVSVPFDYSTMVITQVGGYTGHLARLVKNRFGLLPRTEANRLMVQSWCSAQMKEHGVRPTHGVRILPMAVALSFVATAWDIAARRLEATQEVADRALQAGVWNRKDPHHPWWKFWANPTIGGVQYSK